MNPYAVAADLVVTLHFGYLLFTVGGALCVLVGGLAGWRWIRNRLFRILHLAAVLFVAFEALIGMWCPLTIWEYRLRELAGGLEGERISFVARIIRRLMFFDLPPWFFLLLYLGFGALVLASFYLIPPRRREDQKKRPRR